MNIYLFKTVSDYEVKLLLSQIKFQNLFKIIKAVSLLQGFPKNWLLTSIDYSSQDGSPRVLKGNSGNHFDSHAVDIVPLTSDLKIRLPIPLNRNLLLMKTFKGVCEKYDSQELPIIAFEADHIHCDVNHNGGVAYFNQVRRLLDREFYEVVKANQSLDRIFNSGDVTYL